MEYLELRIALTSLIIFTCCGFLMARLEYKDIPKILGNSLVIISVISLGCLVLFSILAIWVGW